MPNDDFLNDDLDSLDASLSDGARAAIKKAEEDAGITGDGPGSVADYSDMETAALLALADVGSGTPPLLAQPESFTRKAWITFLKDHGIAVPS